MKRIATISVIVIGGFLSTADANNWISGNSYHPSFYANSLIPEPYNHLPATHYVLPQSTATTMPGAIAGKEYSDKQGQAIILNPYVTGQNNYFIKTLNNGLAVNDTLLFSVDPNSCGWLKIDSDNGQLSGTPPKNSAVNCVLHLAVKSQLMKKTARFDFPISVNFPPFIAQWIDGQQPPAAQFGSAYSYNLNSAVETNTPHNAIKLLRGSVWECDWLQLTPADQLVSNKKAPRDLNAACKISVKVVNPIIKQTVELPVVTITIAPNPKVRLSWDSEVCPLTNLPVFDEKTIHLQDCIISELNGVINSNDSITLAKDANPTTTMSTGTITVTHNDEIKITPKIDEYYQAKQYSATLLVHSAASDADQAVTIGPITATQNPGAIIAKWNTAECGKPNKTIEAYSNQQSVSIADLSTCVQAYYRGIPINDPKLAFAMSGVFPDKFKIDDHNYLISNAGDSVADLDLNAAVNILAYSLAFAKASPAVPLQVAIGSLRVLPNTDIASHTMTQASTSKYRNWEMNNTYFWINLGRPNQTFKIVAYSPVQPAARPVHTVCNGKVTVTDVFDPVPGYLMPGCRTLHSSPPDVITTNGQSQFTFIDSTTHLMPSAEIQYITISKP